MIYSARFFAVVHRSDVDEIGQMRKWAQVELTYAITTCNSKSFEFDFNVVHIPFLADNHGHVVRDSFRCKVPLWGHMILCVVTDNAKEAFDTGLVSQAVDLWSD